MGLKFVRQVPIGKYIVDFACRENKIIIEIDGGQHKENKNRLKDQKSTEYIKEMGYKEIRFWNNEIDENIEGVYLRLIDFIKKCI